MAQAIPAQHPAVVLRSHYNHLRALLAVAIIAITGLSAAVVILATNDQTTTSSSVAKAIRAPTPEYPVAADVAPSQPRPTVEQTFPGLACQVRGLSLDCHGHDFGDKDTPGPTPYDGKMP
jgi:hypothetical protein